MIRAVLLDIDGTLLDSNAAHAHAWAEAFEAYGYDVPFERVYPLVGMGGDKLLGALTPGLREDVGTGKQIAQRRKQIFLEKYLADLQPTSGARDLVLKLRDRGLKTVLATSAKSEELQALEKSARIDDVIEERATSDDASSSKPDPDIVLAALQKSGFNADEVVMIGDTPYDLESAAKAGVRAIALRSGGHHDSEFAGAIAIYDDPADLLGRFNESILGRATQESSRSSE